MKCLLRDEKSRLWSVDILIPGFITYKCNVVNRSLRRNTGITQVNDQYMSHRGKWFTVAGCCSAAQGRPEPAEERPRPTQRCCGERLVEEGRRAGRAVVSWIAGTQRGASAALPKRLRHENTTLVATS